MSNQKTVQTNFASQNLATGALSQVLTIADENVELLSVNIGFSAAVSQVISVTHKSVNDLTKYIFVVDTATTSSATTYRYKANPPDLLKRGDTITIACANSGTPASTAYSMILYRVCN